ncbi:MAG: ABC transporter permease, partial [Pseudomonas putida]
MKNRNPSVAGSVALLVLFLVLWQWGPGLVGMPEFVMPQLSRVAQESLLMWQSGNLLEHTLITAFE